ncbi:MAG: hypothetical protein AAF721_25160 [Myxococcota bacterium]
MNPFVPVLEALAHGRVPPWAQVEAVVEAARDIEDVAWHPTGFVVARLTTTEHLALRLHVWPDEARVYGEPLWPLHDHVWSLHSLVIAGTVGTARARVVDDRHGAGRRYAVDYAAGNTSQLVARGGPVRCVVGPRQSVQTGASYSVPAGEYHASSATEGRLAATLVATRRGPRAQPFVVGPADGPERVFVRRETMPASRWRPLLARVRAGVRSRRSSQPS